MNDDIKEHVTPVALLPKEVSERPAVWGLGSIFLFFIFPFQMKLKFYYSRAYRFPIMSHFYLHD
jgi:hypothetical protein